MARLETIYKINDEDCTLEQDYKTEAGKVQILKTKSLQTAYVVVDGQVFASVQSNNNNEVEVYDE